MLAAGCEESTWRSEAWHVLPCLARLLKQGLVVGSVNSLAGITSTRGDRLDWNNVPVPVSNECVVVVCLKGNVPSVCGHWVL